MAKFAKRSRTGCANCKEWKVKCDEGKPSCQRCEKRGKLCTYSLNIKIKKYDKSNLSLTTTHSTKDTLKSLFQRNFSNKDNSKDFSKVLKLKYKD